MAGTRFLDPSSIPLKRQRGGNIWATLVPIIQGAIVIGLLAVVGLFCLPVFQTEKHYKEQIATLQREAAAAEEQQTQLKLQMEYMKNNPGYVEHIARDQPGRDPNLDDRDERSPDIPAALALERDAGRVEYPRASH